MLDLDPPALLVLPGPISTNALFSNVPGRGRVMSKEYKAWKRLAEQTLAAQRPLPRFALPVCVTFYVGERHVGQMDSDNTLKAYMDAIKTAGVIHDDSRKWVRRTAAVWVPAMGGCVCRIKVADMDVSGETLRRLVRPKLQGLI
jgi:Holliday junction resolvase RusA-like endonuclease